jgi:werner syndrome-like exonuclease
MSKRVRKYSEWMVNRRQAVGDAISNIVTSTKSLPMKENVAKNFDDCEEPTNKRRLRSNYSFSKPDDEAENKFNKADLPLVTYDGKIHYLSDFYGIAEACENLIKKIDAKGDAMVGVAFDMEWTFSFKSGPEKTSLIQICLEMDECYLFHLPLIKKLPASLYIFLNHPKVILHGVNIKNDLRKLERDFPNMKADPLISKCIDLGVWYNEIFNSSGRWSMERLVLQVLRLRIDKSRHVRMSKWHVYPLNENQQKYASIDVYVSRIVRNF